MNLTFKRDKCRTIIKDSANSPTQLLIMFVLPATLESTSSVELLLPTVLILSTGSLKTGL